MTQPSLGMTSSIRNSPTAPMISVRRGWEYFAFRASKLLLDHGQQLGLRFQNAAQLLDQLDEIEVFGLNLVAFQAGELVQAQVKNRVSLPLRQRIAGHQAGLGLLPILGGADDPHEVVKIVEGDLVAFQEVGAVLGLAEAELRAARDDLAAVLDVALDELLDVHLLGPLLVEGQQDDAEGRFECGLLEELVDDNLGLFAPLELDDDAGVLVGLVAEVADATDLLVSHQVGNPGDEGGAVDVVGDLGDDDLFAAALELLGVRLAPHADDALAGLEIGNDALATGDDAAGRKIGARNQLDDFIDRNVGLVDDVQIAVISSSRLCGGMLVAMPTAMPVEPFISRPGRAAGRTVGSVVSSL